MNYYLYLRDDMVEVAIDVTYHATYRPAKISGPVEQCHDDESELEVTGYTLGDITYWCPECDSRIDQDGPTRHSCCTKVPIITLADVQSAFDNALPAIEDACWEDFQQARFDAR